MLQFNELRITPDGKHLVIDVEVKPNKYYDRITISKITIDSQDTFIDNGPSSRPIYTHIVSQENSRRVNLILDKSDLNIDLATNMIFVYAEASGTPAYDTPCGMDNKYTIGVAVYLYHLYQQALGFMKELNVACTIPRGFIDYLLRFKAFQLAVKTGHYRLAIKYWKRFFSGIKYETILSKCNCYG